MAIRTLTSANAVITLTVVDLFDAPQQLQGFSAEDVFSTSDVKPVETLMGVDSKLSAGYAPYPVPWEVVLQSTSLSIDFFEQIQAASDQIREAYVINGECRLPAQGKVYTMTNGFLTSYSPTPALKKIAQPRKFEITWESLTASPI